MTSSLFSWYCAQIASKDTPLLPPGSAFRRITHASSPNILVLSVSLLRCCLSPRFRYLLWPLRFAVVHFAQQPYASLLGRTLRPLCFRYIHLSVLVLYSFAFRPMVPRQPSRSNLADPDIILGSVLCFLLF